MAAWYAIFKSVIKRLMREMANGPEQSPKIFVDHAAMEGNAMTDLRPTEAELEILGVLWRRGPATVREVHDELALHRGTGYTTTLKFMQLMLAKGLVSRDDSKLKHVYSAVLKPAPAQRQILRRLISSVFTGSTRALMQQALNVGELEPGELAEIRDLIDAHAAKARTKEVKSSARRQKP
jgi:BlaI family penicillinase repressor